jgi:hypothetical protein
MRHDECTFLQWVEGVLVQAHDLLQHSEAPDDQDTHIAMDCVASLSETAFLGISRHFANADRAKLEKSLWACLDVFMAVGVPRVLAIGCLAQLLLAARDGQHPYVQHRIPCRFDEGKEESLDETSSEGLDGSEICLDCMI